MKRVLCNATVDRTDENIVVTVVGSGDDTGKTSSYLFPPEETEDSAAMESIRRFVSENGGDL
jgi:hypothetical protein